MRTDKKLIDYEEMAMHSLDLIASFDINGYILFVSSACKEITGYDSTELTGRHFSEFLHPDDVSNTSHSVLEVAKTETKANFINRYIHKNGHEVFINWTGAWSEKDGLLYCTGRDTSEQKAIQARLEESEQRYRALFENSSEIMFVENKEGVITEANPWFKKAFQINESEVVQSSASRSLPPDIAVLNEKYLQLALQGKSIRFNMELERDGEIKVYDTFKHPIIANEKVVCVQTIVRDITSDIRSYETIERQAVKLNTIFESITDAFLTLDKAWKLTYINGEAERLLRLDRQQHLGKNISDIFPVEAGGEFKRQYTAAIETGKAVHFTSYSKGLGLWFKVKAFPSSEGLSIYFDDVTEQVTSKQELEKLSLVASKVNNGVIIADREDRIEWVNEGFTKLTGYSLEEAVGKTAAELLRSNQTDLKDFNSVKDKLLKGEPASFEIQNSKKNGEDVWISVQVSPTLNENGEISKFVAIHTDITEQVRARQELEKLSLVASQTTNGVFISNKNRRIEWVNEGFTRLTGYSKEEAIGQIPSLLLYNEKADIRTLEPVISKMSKGEPASFEILNSKKNREDMWLSVQINPIKTQYDELSGYVTIQTDITEQVKARKEFEKLSLVASKTNNSVLIADKDWKIEWVNDGFTRLMGYSLQEAVGTTPSELLFNQNSDDTTFDLQKEKLLKGEPISLEILNEKKNGEPVWVSVDITAILDDNGEVVKYIEVQTDITALKNSELELSNLTKDLYRQNKDLQQFTYIVSHNLRAPVANVMGLANLLTKTDKSTALYEKSLSYLKNSAQQLDEVLKDVNKILSIRDSTESSELEMVDLKFAIQQAEASLEDQFLQCNGKLFIDLADGLMVKANKAYLHSIFYNLISNTIKYRMEERLLEVQIKCYSNTEDGVLLSFSDNGSGFDMAKANGNIFKLYKRFHSDRKGRGIGLYLVKSHLEAMGGYVEVISEVGVGTRFLIYLPKL